MIFFCIFPFLINGHYWFNTECRFSPQSENCSEFYFTYVLISSIVNSLFGTVSFTFIVVSVLYSRKQYTSSTPTAAKIERRLILQTFISSFFLILLTITVMVATLIPHNTKTLLILANLANVLFALHHYPGMIILFFVSPIFRQRCMEFYRINAFLRLLKLKSAEVGIQISSFRMAR